MNDVRDMTLEEMEEITRHSFARYVEPLAETMMTGEVPSVALHIHKTGTLYSDWLAKVKFRNSSAVSVFHCTVYLEDVMRLCRKCKMYLITKDVFNVSILYYMIHPLYQSEWITSEDTGDYESMMLSASKQTCQHIRKYYPLQRDEENVLEILKYWMMLFTNRSYGRIENPKESFDKALTHYIRRMMSTRKEQYITARRFKAQTTTVSEDGFMLLERIQEEE